MGIQAAEISAILKEQIKNFGQDAQVAEAQAKSKEMIAQAKQQLAAEAAAAKGSLEAEARSLAGKIATQILDGRAA